MTVDPIRPANLKPRGAALWSALVKTGTPVATKIVIAEACRLADRLDDYDRTLTGGDDSLTPTALAGLNSEARLTAATLQRILVGLDGAPAGTGTPDDPSAEKSTAGSIHDEVSTRRAARQANAAG